MPKVEAVCLACLLSPGSSPMLVAGALCHGSLYSQLFLIQLLDHPWGPHNDSVVSALLSLINGVGIQHKEDDVQTETSDHPYKQCSSSNWWCLSSKRPSSLVRILNNPTEHSGQHPHYEKSEHGFTGVQNNYFSFSEREPNPALSHSSPSYTQGRTSILGFPPHHWI